MLSFSLKLSGLDHVDELSDKLLAFDLVSTMLLVPIMMAKTMNIKKTSNNKVDISFQMIG